MAKKIFTAMQQAEELERISHYQIDYGEMVCLWGNIRNGEVYTSTYADEYSDYKNNPNYKFIDDIFDFKYNVEYVAEDGLEALIESNNLDDFEIEVEENKLALLNCSILTMDGSYSLKSISLEEAKDLIKENKNNLDSAIGHQSTAEIMTTLLEEEIVMNRQKFQQNVGQEAIVFCLNRRVPEGKILSLEEIEEIGYSFKLLTRTK